MRKDADFGSRAVASVIDSFLLAAMHSLIFLSAVTRFGHDVPHFKLPAILALYSSYLFIFMTSFVFLHMIYFTLFHAWTGRTIGKMIMGIRVITRDAEQLTPGKAFLRWTGYFLSFMPLGAGFLWAAVDRDHCAWHDRLAATRVVSVEMT